MLRATGDITGALKRYEASLAIFESLANADRSNAIAARSLAISYGQIGDTLRLGLRPREAVAMYQKALDIQRGLATRDPENAQAQKDIAELAASMREVDSRAESPVRYR